jgi:(+)-pinoresinol hydroxylase
MKITTLRAVGPASMLAALCAVSPAASLAGGPPRTAGVTTDSGGPAISWTWAAVTPGAGEPRGYVEFQRACSVCHGRGPAPGTRALRAKYQGKLPALLEERTDLTPDYVRYIVRHGVTVMPPFRKTELADAQLDAIASYLTRKGRAAEPSAR